MVHHLIRMCPVVATRLILNIGPGKILDDPGCTHLAHHCQALLDFPLLNFVGQTGVDTHLRVCGDHALLWPQGNVRRHKAVGPERKERQPGYTDDQHNNQTSPVTKRVHTCIIVPQAVIVQLAGPDSCQCEGKLFGGLAEAML